MDLVVPSFLNNLPAAINFNKGEEDTEPKLKAFVQRIDAVEFAVQDTTEKVESFISMMARLDNVSDSADDDKDNSEKDDGEDSSSDHEQDFELANASLIAAETALLEAKRRISVAEIAFREAEREFQANRNKIAQSNAELAKAPKKTPAKAEANATPYFGDMLGMLNQNFENLKTLIVSARTIP
jgi:hypothetical protein